MNINFQFQDLCSHEFGVAEWAAVQIVERDICLLFHQLADYSSIMGDLYYGDVYTLPYWEYLDVHGLDPERRQFLRNGCLVMLYAMASEVLGGDGSYLVSDPQRLSAAKTAVDSLAEFDQDTNRLVRAVRLSLELVAENRREAGSFGSDREISAASSWIHKRFVRQYFQRRAEDFRSVPYYTDL